MSSLTQTPVTITDAQSMVRQFMELVGARTSADVPRLTPENYQHSSDLMDASIDLTRISRQLKLLLTHGDQPGDVRMERAAKLIEEVAELIEGLARRDEVKVLDGIADSQYLLLGTAVVFDLPAEAAFKEVHSSNMTKRRTPGESVLAVRGPAYRAPDLEMVLSEYRDSQ